ncbi:MAG: cupin domain-containing protein [Minwuia sp.]|nr:cupin domain-containing protein [Minwuia sp.]
MNTAEFEAGLERDGYENAGVKSLEPGCHNDAHARDFAVRAMVVEGGITLTVDGEATSYGPGDTVVMAAGCERIEDVRPDGLKFLVGRKH